MKLVVILNIGSACYPSNPGEQGAWSFRARSQKHGYDTWTSGGIVEQSGAILGPVARSRVMLVAALKGLESIGLQYEYRASQTTLVSGERFIVDAINDWRLRWRDSDWRTRNGTRVRNLDLWRPLDELCNLHNVSARWIGDYTGRDPEQEEQKRCDTLAKSQAADSWSQRRIECAALDCRMESALEHINSWLDSMPDDSAA